MSDRAAALKPRAGSGGSTRPGAQLLGGDRCLFTVWAPKSKSVSVKLVYPYEKTVRLDTAGAGFFKGVLENVAVGTRYWYVLDDGKARPDPASRYQPEGVGGPSGVVDSEFAWQDRYWCGLPLEDYVFYELHVGAFTREGTFDAASGRLGELKELGITAVELMPLAEFPGDRNWGYDGVFPYSVHHGYGGPAGLKRFVNAAHRLGLAVVLDVVYNHLGKEGASLEDFGPYTEKKYRTVWGPALNFDGRDSDAVKTFFLENALYWLDECRVDALRLDAVGAIHDASVRPFLERLGEAVAAFGSRMNRLVYAIAESAKNDARLLKPREMGGAGLDAQWSFDFHHALHALLTGEREGYYGDYGGSEDLAKAYREGVVYTGQYSKYWGRAHGRATDGLTGRKFVVYAQNHDEIGNRPRGDRYGLTLSLEGQKLAAAGVLLSPFLPLLFMGEEYGETAPFLFFVEYGSRNLAEAVRDGRRAESRAFGWEAEMASPLPRSAFERSKLRWNLRKKDRHRHLLAWYRELLRLRRELPALKELSRERTDARALGPAVVYLLRRAAPQGTSPGGAAPERSRASGSPDDGRDAFALLHFGDVSAEFSVPAPRGSWKKLLDSAEERWGGPGPEAEEALGVGGGAPTVRMPPRSVALYERMPE